MSDTYIRITGEEAEIFAQKLLEIPGISLPDGMEEDTYRSGISKRTEAIILNVVSSLIAAGIVELVPKIAEVYKNQPNPPKIEISVIEPDKDIYIIDPYSPVYNKKKVENSSQEDSLNDSPPSLNTLPSLQEIAKLSIEDRHQLLSPYMENMAEVFNNDPDLVNCWHIDGEE